MSQKKASKAAIRLDDLNSFFGPRSSRGDDVNLSRDRRVVIPDEALQHAVDRGSRVTENDGGRFASLLLDEDAVVLPIPSGGLGLAAAWKEGCSNEAVQSSCSNGTGQGLASTRTADGSKGEHLVAPDEAPSSIQPCASGPDDAATSPTPYMDTGPTAQDTALAEQEATRARVAELLAESIKSDPKYDTRPIADLNSEAVALFKAGDAAGAVAAYSKLFLKVAKGNVTRPDLYVAYSNRAAGNLTLGLYDEALKDADRCQSLAQVAFSRDRAATASSAYIKAFYRKGCALLGLLRPREASLAFTAGLQADPSNEELKAGLELATQRSVEDLVSGRGREILLLPPKEKTERISSLPFSTPLHRIHPRDMLPTKLLTPFQAENDHHVKDTYNYMTVQADIRLPYRHFRYLEDKRRGNALETAIARCVSAISAEGKDPRVLVLGGGAGLTSMLALRSGAYHVTCTERWLYLAMAAKESLLANGYADDQVKVIYKRPTDLSLIKDVPVACNLLIAEGLLDDTLLNSGLLPAIRYAREKLLIGEARVLPMSATVFVQAVQILTQPDAACGLDVGMLDRHRWHPAMTSGVPLTPDLYIPLSGPREVWHFDLLMPPEAADTRTIDLDFERDGLFNAVLMWYELQLCEGVTLTTAPMEFRKGSDSTSTLNPSLQYLAGVLRVEAGQRLPIQASHNTVRMQFDMERAEYLYLSQQVKNLLADVPNFAQDASFPRFHFSAVADECRNAAYSGAIKRAVARRKQNKGEAHVLDVGTGSGIFAMMAARVGADTVVACDLHPTMAKVARRNVAANQLSEKVTVVHRDAALLERGREMRRHGVNIVIADLFDAGLLGDHIEYMLSLVKRNVAVPDVTIIPAAATVYCMGIEAYTSEVKGFDFSAFNKFRWHGTYRAEKLSDVPHRRLTAPKKVFDIFLEDIPGSEKGGKGRGRESVLKLDVTAGGYLNAVVFWFDLHLDEHETITTAPAGIGPGGVVMESLVEVESPAEAMQAALQRYKETLESNPRTQLGALKAMAETNSVAAEKKELDATTGAILLSSAASQPSISEEPNKEHYWGQAIEYLDRAAQVVAGKKLTVIAKIEKNRIHFALREGVGEQVGKPPWRIEWGGGASIENPHVQRVHYCELLIRDFLMRLRSNRFPPIEKDMRMIMAHGGSLFLDSQALAEVYHELVVLEMVHKAGWVEFSPGASMEAVTKPITSLS